jgi:hypothetical protein
MTIDYLLGTDRETGRRADHDAATVAAPAEGAEADAGRHHAVAAAAIVDGSDSAIALCGATVRVWRGSMFPPSDSDSAVLHDVCAELVVAARHAATSQDDAPA